VVFGDDRTDHKQVEVLKLQRATVTVIRVPITVVRVREICEINTIFQ
jgi:hypothetical protein